MTQGNKRLHFVFDVESIGLHGEGFAVGYVVVANDGTEIESGYAACPSSTAHGDEVDRLWIKDNVLPHLKLPSHDDPAGVRDYFWRAWMSWRPEALMWADCGWPVEANFLSACVNDDPENRTWEGPYPLSEISTVLATNGLDPLTTYPRLETEEPAHNPLSDARQSARLLIENLGGQYGEREV